MLKNNVTQILLCRVQAIEFTCNMKCKGLLLLLYLAFCSPIVHGEVTEVHDDAGNYSKKWIELSKGLINTLKCQWELTLNKHTCNWNKLFLKTVEINGTNQVMTTVTVALEDVKRGKKLFPKQKILQGKAPKHTWEF